ncbi:MAG: hypothetical protein WA484_11400, partial [Solirubrobacteraceae bacterium]
MTNPKRASMREGPLAALFRKTEDLEKDPSAEQQPAPVAATPAGASEAAAEASSTSSRAASAPSEEATRGV